MSDLEPIRPDRAVQMYIRDRENELSDATIYSHRSRLSHFVEWCDENDIDELRELTGLDLHEYRLWRRDAGINAVTEKTQMDTLRVFTRWCESVEAVRSGLSDKVLSPSLSNGENERDIMLDPEAAAAILDYLSRFEYATREHTVMVLITRGLLRRGGVRALDTGDCHLNGPEPYLQVRHRPETDTPLKNRSEGERDIALKPDTADILQDYIDHHRNDVTDDDREPLLTTSQGRPHRTTIQADVYAVTRPCAVGNECPHGKNPETCAAAQDRQRAYECPSSLSPHPVRRGAITYWLRNDVPEVVVGARASTDPAVLSTHYDQRTLNEKMNQRRRYLDNL